MLAAGIEAEPGEEALTALNRHSQALWPGFAAELADAGDVDVGLRREGTIWAALTRDDAAELRFRFDYQRRVGINLHWLGGAEARRLEPCLHPQVPAAILSPDDHQVDNRRLVEALAVAFRRAGGTLHEQAPVTGLDLAGGRVAGLWLGERRVIASTVVLAAGAWSPDLPGLPASARPPVRPVKGQMLALAMDPAAPLLRHVLWAGRSYLVPRRDGRLIVGATTEECGFDASLTAGGMLALLDGAWRALPGVAELKLIESWAGFRPGSRDDAPVLGATPVPGLVLATGHHRNGILLTPVTANAISQLILTGETDPAIAGFGLDRFARTARRATEAAPCSVSA
jgi:glycine oxidase